MNSDAIFKHRDITRTYISLRTGPDDCQYVLLERDVGIRMLREQPGVLYAISTDHRPSRESELGHDGLEPHEVRRIGCHELLPLG